MKRNRWTVWRRRKGHQPEWLRGFRETGPVFGVQHNARTFATSEEAQIVALGLRAKYSLATGVGWPATRVSAERPTV